MPSQRDHGECGAGQLQMAFLNGAVFFNDTATTEIYTLSLHDALPIWVIPFTDCVNQSGGLGRTIPIPLYQLVYHDAVLISYGEARRGGHNQLLLGCLCGGVPELPVNLGAVSKDSLDLMKKMAALNKRVGLLEMTNHEFLDANRRQERTTFSDSTTVTVDWDKSTAQIEPPLN